MPFRWTFSEQEELVHVVGEGSVDLTTVVEAIFGVVGSAEFSPEWRVLVDLTEMEFEPEPREAAEIARVLTTVRSLLAGRVAIVAVGKALGLVRMASSMASESGLTIRPFCELGAARAWLLSAEPKI